MPHVAVAVAAAFASVTTAGVAAAATALSATVLFTVGSTVVTIGTAISAIATAASIATAVASLGRQPPVAASGASPTAFKADPNAGVPIAFGETGIGPFIVHASANGKANNTAYLGYRLVYSAGGPIESFGTFTASGEAVAFTSDAGEGASGRWRHRMWMKRTLGAPGQAALQMTAVGTKDTPANHGGNQPEWTSAHRLQGLASAFWVLQADPAKYPNGVPKPLQVGRWIKVWDPRKDSTYPGGDGPQRPDDPLTWSWTRNPYLIALAWLRGRVMEVAGRTVRAWGVGAPLKWIDTAAYVEGANVADANGWTCDGVCYSTEDKFAVLVALLQAGGGAPCPKGGLFSCTVRTPRPSLTTLTADDLASGEIEVETGAS